MKTSLIKTACFVGLGALLSCSGQPAATVAPPRRAESVASVTALPAKAPSFLTPPVIASAAPAAPPPDARPDPLPAGFVRVGEDGMGSVTCGNLTITVEAEAPKEFRRFVRVTGPDGKRLYEAHGRHFQYMDADMMVEFCGDLTGDGVPEIVMTERTMGAHCCYTRYVVSLTNPPKRILFWEKGDAGTDILPVKYGPGTSWQLQDLMVTWPPFDTEKGDPVLSYASAPLVPVIFSLVNGNYQLTSLAYPQAYLQQRDSIVANCDKSPSDCFGQIIYWIDSLAIGDWDAAKSWVKDEELRKALDRRAPGMKKMLQGLGSKGRPVDPTPR